MGSGKTSVGREVADALGCPFIDLDEVIVKKSGRSIPDIFAADGEAGFRLLERQALLDTVSKYAESTAVLALGGGTVTVPGAVELLQSHTLCIDLRATEETIRENLAGATVGRPLAGDGGGILRFLRRRIGGVLRLALDVFQIWHNCPLLSRPA